MQGQTKLSEKKGKRVINPMLEQAKKKAGPTSATKSGFGPATMIITLRRRRVKGIAIDLL